MPDFVEESNFVETIPLIEVNDIVIGGSEDSGPNRLASPLVDRTRYLKNEQDTLKTKVNGGELFDLLKPVGTIHYSRIADNPATYPGWGGTWVAIKGRVLVGIDDTAGSPFGTAGVGVGATEVQLSVAQMPNHAHTAQQDPHNHGYTDFSIVINSGLAGDAGNNDGQIINRGTDLRQPPIVVNPEGGNQPHTNIQPSLVVYIWERTA